jgi:hypothetical protein
MIENKQSHPNPHTKALSCGHHYPQLQKHKFNLMENTKEVLKKNMNLKY